MAAPTLRGVGAYASGTTSFVAAVPTGGSAPVSGDAMYIIMSSSDSATAAGTPSTPAGWSSLFEATVGPGATNVTTLTVFGKIAGVGEGNVTVNGVLDHCSGAMVVVQDHGLSVIGDTVVGAHSDHGTTQTGCSTSGITVVASSFIILAIGFTDDANDVSNGTNYANTNLASIAEQIDRTVNTAAGGGVGIVTATCAGTTTGATTWDHDTAANSGSVHLGIKPVPATAALTTVLGTGSVGSFGTIVSVAITGNAGTGAVGSFGTSISYSAAITGNVGTGAVGSLVPSFVLALSGLSATGAVGSLASTISVALSGNEAQGAVGSFTKSVSLGLSGNAGTGAVGLFAPTVSVTLSGNFGTGAVGTITVSGGAGAPVVVAFNRQSMAGGVTVHTGVSRPTILNQDSTTKDYKQHDFKPDGVNRETYTVDGVIP